MHVSHKSKLSLCALVLLLLNIKNLPIILFSDIHEVVARLINKNAEI